MSKYCANCAVEIPGGADICDNCGMPVSAAPLPKEAPSQKVPAQPPRTLPVTKESTPDRRSRIEQSEWLLSSKATPPDSVPAQDPHRGEQRRGVTRWVIRAAGFVGTAVAGLLGMAAFRRQSTDVLAQNPTVDGDTQQNMGVVETIEEDPEAIDQIQPDPGLINQHAEIPPPPTEAPLVTTSPDATAAPPPPTQPVDEFATTEPGAPTLDPNLLDPTAPGPTLDTGLVERVEQNPELVEAINQNPDIADALQQDPTSIDQIELDLGLAEQRPIEPSGATEPSPTEPPDVLEPDPAGDQDLDDQPNP